MKALITGVAGFIGSTLAGALLKLGEEVVGVDSFTPYYDAESKRRNIAAVLDHPRFEFLTSDLRVAELCELMAGIDVIYHLAAQPGVRLSWGDGFATYDEQNVLVTQRVLEAARATGIGRLVFASSSSVYGNCTSYPTTEDSPLRPFSPYGVTKLAAESLCNLYSANWGVPAVSLRFFTVYGPRQRPDMAIHRLIEAGVSGTAFSIYGSGGQVRDFTYVTDAVAACIAAGKADLVPGTVLNIAGGSSASLSKVVELAGEIMPGRLSVSRQGAQPGDVIRTGGSVEKAFELLKWQPEVSLRTGLELQVAWHLNRRRGQE
jgi:UDP-glucuronate 4-epimerase